MLLYVGFLALISPFKAPEKVLFLCKNYSMDKIQQILNGPMLCESGARSSLLIAIVSAIKNGSINAMEEKLTNDDIVSKAYAMNPISGKVQTADEYELNENDLPDNSVAVLWLEGMIYPWKSYRLEQQIIAINENPRIVATLVVINSPGGMVHRVDITTNAIKNSTKPVVAYVTGLACSGAMWLASAAHRIFCASPGDQLGSIGVMTTYMNDKKFFESMGMETKDIYATLSTEKNEQGRAAEAGDFAPIVSNLDFYNDLFHKTISENLGIALDTENHVFKGRVFFAQEAIALGLAHEMGDMNTALNYALSEGMKVQANNKF